MARLVIEERILRRILSQMYDCCDMNLGIAENKRHFNQIRGWAVDDCMKEIAAKNLIRPLSPNVKNTPA